MKFKTFDHVKLERHFEGDEEILLDMIEVFEEAHSGLLEAILAARKLNNVTELRIKAHTLKGVMSNFYAMDARESAFAIEVAAREEKLHNVDTLLSELQSHIGMLVIELKDFKMTLNRT